MKNPLNIIQDENELKFPKWLRKPLPKGTGLTTTNDIIQKKRLHTVCEEAKCPNLFECYSKKTATFLILGKECTRSCGFCSIDFSKKPKMPSADEPEAVADSVLALGLKHVVITMVARDDLPDGGAKHLVQVMQAVRKKAPFVTIEVLTSDFQGDTNALDLIIQEKPEIFNHNIETVRSLTPKVRHTATYDRSLFVLSYIKQQNLEQMVKSGIMLGLGEKEDEVVETLSDLKKAGCDIVTIGQYLQPISKKLQVKEFIHPDQFKMYEQKGYDLGFKYVYSGPFVRSSYNADLVIQKANQTITITSE